MAKIWFKVCSVNWPKTTGVWPQVVFSTKKHVSSAPKFGKTLIIALFEVVSK